MLKKIFWIVLIITVLLWIGVGVYYFQPNILSQPQFDQLQIELETKEADTTIENIETTTVLKKEKAPAHQPPKEKISDVPLDVPSVVGIITETTKGQFIIQADKKDYAFFLDNNSQLFFPEESEGVVIGERMKIYYKEKDGQLYVVEGIGLKK